MDSYGSKVKCINNIGASELTVGATYTVIGKFRGHSGRIGYKLLECRPIQDSIQYEWQGFTATRFVVVEEKSDTMIEQFLDTITIKQ